jgi:hypothetical protein
MVNENEPKNRIKEAKWREVTTEMNIRDQVVKNQLRTGYTKAT